MVYQIHHRAKKQSYTVSHPILLPMFQRKGGTLSSVQRSTASNME
ncbi:hypothetical protein NBRC111894_2815 [Sporolactobacillus inulinus]|uniref:Uncharacterized protein n=1 Tax=Sporolactobacillus inulinus TaxID=2078 RepID=A0A4Y1ZE89_9BACL|nr:hypothetical protein NBRC111894_2815 [Sporolactobacillus inulinus]